MYLEKRRIGNRGFLIGPVIPIYGTGALLITLFLNHTDNFLAIFCVAVIGSGVLEYLTSYIMEKLFHVRWWDYSHNHFNINGRICLETLILFGIFGIIVLNVINPFFLWLLGKVNPFVLDVIAIVLLIIFVADIVGSLYLITRFRVAAGTVEKDATEEISQHIREIIMQRGRLSKRLVKAFPDLEVKKTPPHKRKPKSESKTIKKSAKKSAKKSPDHKTVKTTNPANSKKDSQ